MKRLRSIVILIIISLMAALPALASSVNLVVNGDFEETDSEMMPENWQFDSYHILEGDLPGNAYAECQIDAERGTVVYMRSEENDDAKLYQTVRVEPSSIYRLSCYVKTYEVKPYTEDEPNAGANIALVGDIVARSEGLYGSNDWTKLVLVGKTGPTQTELVVSCRLGGYSEESYGEAWFDDFAVEKLKSSSAEIVPFYRGDVEEEGSASSEKDKSVLPAVIVICSVAALCAGIFFLVRFIKKTEPDIKKPAPVIQSGKNSRRSKNKQNKLDLIRGKSFFHIDTDSLPEPTDIKLHFKKKDWIFVIALTVVYAFIGLFGMGTLKFPTSAYKGNTGDTVRIEFESPTVISAVWQNSGISYCNYKIVTDEGETITPAASDRNSYGNMFRWHKLKGVSAPTTGLTLTVKGGSAERPDDPDLILNELAFFDENGELIRCRVSENGVGLVDEQSTVPEYPSYYNGMYFDELYHGRTALEHIENLRVYEWTHPPLGKLIIAIGILIFGMNPFGWRIMGVLFGIAMVPIMYCFGKRVLKRSELALFATFLFTFDFVHFTQMRIATIDVYGVFFILLMTYFMYNFICMDIGDKLSDMLRQLALSGLFFGLGCASKWICIYTGAALAILFFVKLLLMGVKSCKLGNTKLFRSERLMEKFWRKAIILCAWCLIFFILVPGIIYFASYFRYYTAQWLPDKKIEVYAKNYDQYESPESVELSFSEKVSTYTRGVLDMQKQIFDYHSKLKGDHKGASYWWMWLADLRPTWFYLGSNNPNGKVGTICTYGNPAVWTACNIASLVLVFVLMFHRKRFPLEAYFLFVCMASSLLPWVLVPRTMYAYHFFATVPYTTMATAFLLGYLEDYFEYKAEIKHWKTNFMPYVKYIWMAVALILFIILYPTFSGMEVPREYLSSLQWVPFHKYEIYDTQGELVRTYRIGWRFMDYEPSEQYMNQYNMITKIYR